MNNQKLGLIILLAAPFDLCVSLEKPKLPASISTEDIYKFIEDKQRIGISFENTKIHYGAQEFDISTPQKRDAFLLRIIHGTARREAFSHHLHYDFNSYLVRAEITYNWLAHLHAEVLKKNLICLQEFIPLLQNRFSEKLAKLTLNSSK